MTSLNSLARDLKIIHKSCRICLNDIKLPNILYKQSGKYSYTFVFTNMGIASEDANEDCQIKDLAKFKESIRIFEQSI